jgi:hypothetical protein
MAAKSSDTLDTNEADHVASGKSNNIHKDFKPCFNGRECALIACINIEVIRVNELHIRNHLGKPGLAFLN